MNPLFIEKKPERLIEKDGTRIDGRKPDEMRSIRMEVGPLKKANGSAYLEWGGNAVLAGVYGPREVHPRHMALPDRALLRCRYSLAPFSVPERKRPGPDRRSVELSKVIREALLPSVFAEKYPNTSIDIFIEVLRADAGTRVAGVSAASLALSDAGIPLRGLVAACATGRVGDSILLDLGHEEDMWGDADLPLAMLMETKEITLLQADGTLSPEQFKQALDLALKGCEHVYKIQIEALKRPYVSVRRELEEG